MTSVHGGQGVVAKLLNYTGNTKNCMSPAVPEHVYIIIYISYEMEINLQSFIVIIGIQQLHHLWTLIRLIK